MCSQCVILLFLNSCRLDCYSVAGKHVLAFANQQPFERGFIKIEIFQGYNSSPKNYHMRKFNILEDMGNIYLKTLMKEIMTI